MMMMVMEEEEEGVDWAQGLSNLSKRPYNIFLRNIKQRESGLLLVFILK